MLTLLVAFFALFAMCRLYPEAMLTLFLYSAPLGLLIGMAL